MSKEKIISYIEEKDDASLWKLFYEDKKNFLNSLSAILVKKDDVKKIQYLESLGMELDDKGHPLLWVCVQNSREKSVKYLLKYLIKDSPEAIFCNKIIIANMITEGEKNFNKRMKVLPLILSKISIEKYNEIKIDLEKNVHRSKDQISRDNYMKEIDYLYLSQSLDNTTNIKTKKYKI